MKYESPITYHSKDMANVKVFADRQTDKQTDRWTGQKLYAPSFLIRKKRAKEEIECLVDAIANHIDIIKGKISPSLILESKIRSVIPSQF
jgi:hypothetical protein